MKLKLDGTEKKITKSFKIEDTIYNEFRKLLKDEKDDNSIGLTAGTWIRKQMILFIQQQKNKKS